MILYMKILKKFKQLYIFFKYGNRSFSQEGEDLILDRFLNGKKNGFYIDIGAHHPIKYSNTYKFYLKGWRGINIDAMPGSMSRFKKIRPRDLNLEIPISSKNENLIYHIFNEPALNTFSEKEARLKNGLRNYKVIETKQLNCKTLSEVLSINIAQNQKIDFMTIDVEGLDFDVLVSNNWDLYKPDYILVEELLDYKLLINSQSKINHYLNNLGYRLVARTLNTSVYTNQDV